MKGPQVAPRWHSVSRKESIIKKRVQNHGSGVRKGEDEVQ